MVLMLHQFLSFLDMHKILFRNIIKYMFQKFYFFCFICFDFSFFFSSKQENKNKFQLFPIILNFKKTESGTMIRKKSKLPNIFQFNIYLRKMQHFLCNLIQEIFLSNMHCLGCLISLDLVLCRQYRPRYPLPHIPERSKIFIKFY